MQVLSNFLHRNTHAEYQMLCSIYTELLHYILITRQILPSLHFNENVHQDVKKKNNGEVMTRVW